jgi:hypothetical protein
MFVAADGATMEGRNEFSPTSVEPEVIVLVQVYPHLHKRTIPEGLAQQRSNSSSGTGS